MKKAPLRIIASIMLVVSLLTLSGLTAAADSLFSSSQAKSCCTADSPGTGAEPEGGSCSTPDCPCFSCISVILYPSSIAGRTATGEPLSPLSPHGRPLAGHVRTIEYPPEHA